MRTALLTALLATAAVSVAAPPAAADDPTYECAADLYANDDLAGPGAYLMFIRGYIVHSSDSQATMRCTLYVNGSPTGWSTTASGQSGGIAADLQTVTVGDTDDVRVCADLIVTNHGANSGDCFDTTRTQVPPQAIQGVVDGLEPTITSLVATVEGLVTTAEQTVASVADLVTGLVGETSPVYSARCDAGTRVSDTTVEGVHVKVYLLQPTAGETDVCVRVEDATTGRGMGGQLVVTQGSTGPGAFGLPSADANATACTDTTNPPNSVPGTHPIANVGLGTVTLVLDAYANGSAAWVCVRVDELDVAHRVVVPLPAGPSGPLPNVQYHADPPA